MKIEYDNKTPQELERTAIITINEAHYLAQTANDIVSATCANALATIGLAQATLAASAWNVWITENRQPGEY